MRTTLQLTIDCADPRLLVEFWCAALGYVPEPAPDGHATWREYWLSSGVPEEELPPGAGEEPESIVDPDGVGPRVWFQVVPEAKAVKNRLHLDLRVGGGRSAPYAGRRGRVGAEAERLTGLGARTLRVMDLPDAAYYAVVMQDPEGNEFCVT
ncbi:VOC family protein [Nocardiopsis sp. RSe5-2]|uniref:VOC family protein n=1 Tax=Nocardiopsis endophytica TaxID=3018445 RepID=A0ABT4TYN9_9ACTN|nr:VOC family protein [Nocardiopsis endophytica]MDA2809813.1 VOC family protein [Nocardiopsis endophytica]